MKILILDIYKDVSYRISKDTSGGYGTANDFGNTFFSVFLKKILKKVHDWPPMFAVYTYSVLKKKGFEVEFLKDLPEDFLKYDLFLVVSSIVCCETELAIISKIKKNNKSVFAIGPFASNMPKIYSDVGAVVIIGEPEFYFLNNNNFIEDLNKDSVIVKNNLELDSLPFPYWKKFISKNKKISRLFGNYNTLPILATRGCPYSCFEYCVYPLQQGRKVRQRSIINIVDEMEFMKAEMKTEMFIFRDPVFSINKKHTIELANEIIKRKLNLKFIIETHLRILDSELINILKKAGLCGVKVGIESSNTDVLNSANRFTIEKDKQIQKIRELENNKIKISAMFILGFPFDTEKTMQDTINYAKKLNTTYAQFSIWTPYPGTPIFQEFKKKITSDKFEDYNQYNLVYKNENITKERARWYLERAYKKYYLRFSWAKKFFSSFINE
jgi:radical SAM superfamily enzyme YgiQ (UPF0313 family)